MTKIAIDCTHYIKGRTGGFESYLLNLLDGLLEANKLEITLYILSSQVKSFEKYSRHGALLKPISINNPYTRIAWQNIVLPFYSRRHSVILFPANFRPIFLLSKSVTVIHDLQYIYYPEYWSYARRLLRVLFIPYSILRSDRVIAISNTIKNEINDTLFKVDVDVIYNPIVMRRALGEIDRVKYGFPEGPFFLIPSALDPHKNIKNLLSAIDQLSVQGDTPRFIFTGPYNAPDFCFEYKSERIDIFGYVDVGLLNHLYTECTAVILPSVYEGFGMPYAESLLAHKIVIASDIPIARELLGEYAIYINPPFEKMQILAALELFMQGQRHDLENNATKKLIENTAPYIVAQKYISLLNETL